MKRRLAVFCLLAVPLTVHAQSAPAQSSPEWQAVIGPELQFRFEMPTPIEKSTASQKEKGHASLRIGWSAKLDGQMFDFDFVDYEVGWFSTRDAKVMSKELGRGDAEKAFPKDKYKYTRDELVDLQGWDGYALDIEDPQGLVVMMRTYIVKDRLYRLLVTATADAKTRDAAKRFLDSFKLAEAHP
jgi:hypothetical protein